MAFSAKEKLEKLLEFVNKEEELLTEFSMKAMEEGNIMAMQIHNAEACACMKMRHTIEDMLSHNGSNLAWDSMEFNEAYGYLRKGKKIKLPEWTYYWSFDDYGNIIAHYENVSQLSLGHVEDISEILDFAARNDWMVVEEEK